MAIGINPGVVLIVLLSGAIFYFFLWRAVLCVAPQSMRIEADAPGEKMSLDAHLHPLDKALRALGFTPLGSRLERPWLTAQTVNYDYAAAASRSFATLYLGRDGSARLYYLTPLQGGGFVITADHRRPAREVPGRYLSGGLEDVPPDRLLKAHLRRVETTGKPVDGPFDQDARVEAARAWFSGLGRTEVRLQNLVGLLWSVASLGMLGAAFFGRE